MSRGGRAPSGPLPRVSISQKPVCTSGMAALLSCRNLNNASRSLRQPWCRSTRQVSGPWSHPYSLRSGIAGLVLICCHVGAGQTRLWEDAAALQDDTPVLSGGGWRGGWGGVWSMTRGWKDSLCEKYVFTLSGNPATGPVLTKFCLSKTLVIE